MVRQLFTLCYLTKKQNAIAPLATVLSPIFPKLAASQVLNIDDISLKKEPDIIIADSEFSEITALCPVLHVVSTQEAARYLNDGRIDFITKEELHTHALARAIKNLLEKETLSISLKEATTTDELTGLYNQRFLQDIFAREVKKATRYQTPLTLLYIGIDGLRKINEKFGHVTGDRVIVDLGLIVSNSVREVDVVGRFTGDEFLAILPETAPQDSFKVCARIQHSMKNFAFVGGEAGLNVTVSIGISALCGQIRTKEGLLEAARSALAGAKKRGAGSTCTWEDAALVSEPIEEDKQLIENIQQQIYKITEGAKKSHFQDIIKLLEEIPIYKKMLNHSERVSFYSERLAVKVGLAPEESSIIKRAAFLHDVGKVAIDERLVLKNGPLSGIEYALIKQHPVIASQMLGTSVFMKNETNIILHHHERFDGAGYPDGLQSRHIPLGSRIIGLAEAWDTMITPQPYRDAMSLDQSLSELKKFSGKQFDPEIVAAFTGLIEG